MGLKESFERNPLREGRSYRDYKEFLQERRKISANDLERISKEYSLDIEELNSIKEEIRRMIFDDYEPDKFLALATTYHLIPWELEYYFLASQRIDLLGELVFSIPITYTNPRDEQSFYFTLGDKRLDLRLFFDLSKGTKTAYDFYHTLREKFLEFFGFDKNYNNNFRSLVDQSFNNEEIKKKIKEIIDRKIKSSDLRVKLDFSIAKDSKKIEEEIYFNLLKEIFYLLADFFDFFEGRHKFKLDSKQLSIEERWQKIKSVFDYLFENKTIAPLIQKLNITKESQEYGRDNYYKLIFLILILGRLDHLGAEWAKEDQPGKYNQIREILGLPLLPDIPPQVFVERFSVVSNQYPNSLVLRLLLGDLSNIWYSAAIQGPEVGSFSPLNPELRRRIRIFDFYRVYKKFLSNLDRNEIILKKETIINIFKQYFKEFLEGKVAEEVYQQRLNSIDDFFKDQEQNEYELMSLINEFNKRSPDKRDHIWLPNLKFVIIKMVLPKYINQQVDDDLVKLFFDLGKDQEKLENKLEIELSQKNIFGGINLPFRLSETLTRDDLLTIYYLNYLSKNNSN
jgi:hypothetical protein